MKLNAFVVAYVAIALLGVTQGDSVPASVLSALRSTDYRYFVAGGTCEAISHGITTPIDVAKTRIQADLTKYSKRMGQPAVDILRQEGPNALLGGLGPTVVGYCIELAIKFGVYEICKPIFTAVFRFSSDKSNSSPLAFLLASIMAGAVAALFLSPMKSTVFRIVTDPIYANLGLWKGFPKLVREEGLWSTFDGLWAILANQVVLGLLWAFFSSSDFDWFSRIITTALMASIIECIFSHIFDKLFEEEGPLGKGITVGQIQVALFSKERGSDSIFGDLERIAKSGGDSSSKAHEVCLSLLRRSSDWTAAHSDSKWFKFDDAGKAESLFNNWVIREVTKFAKEYIPSGDSDEKGSATTVVVSLLIAIEGNSTKFQGAGFSLTGTKEVLTSIASDVLVAEGEVVISFEVAWTPSKRDEVLTSTDLIADYPELITL